MDIGAGFPGWTSVPAWGLAAAVLVMATRGLPLARYRDDAALRPVLVAASLAIMALRWFNTAALQGVVLHFLGATVATLLFGARMACWIMAAASLFGVVLGAGFGGWALDFLLTGAVPVAVTVAVSLAAMRWIPANIFTYVMVNAFAAAALAMAASSLAKAGIAAVLGGAAAAYLAATPLLMSAEAFLTGGLMVLVVVYRPHWCASFDDRTYLGPERPM
ncbi:MAG TPA: energy-coupling factor ABC transporter permease [Luteimonas sp.]